MSADAHAELIASLKNYRAALERLATAAHNAAADAPPDEWPTEALRVWWLFTTLGPTGARNALKAWRSWYGVSRADAEKRLKGQGLLEDYGKGSWARWERGEEPPSDAHRHDLAGAIGIPPKAWDPAE